MRKHIEKPSKPEKASLSVKKLLIVSAIFLALTGMMSVMATKSEFKSVKIVLSSGYEMNATTTSTRVEEILKEKGVVISEDEIVTPNLSEDISENKTITITKGKKMADVPENHISEEEILGSYTSIVEKKVTIQEEIPFDTETKDVSNGSEEKQEKVVQAGSNGLKELTYDIKYQNGEEIEKEVIAENVVKEPVKKVVEIRAKVVSRGTTSTPGTAARATGTAGEAQAYAQKRCADYGWSDNDFNCLVALWNKESGWNANAHNSRSGAHGIPQALPASKMSSAGSDYMTNYKTQVNWGLGYIKSRYGSPSAAWSHSQRTGWY